MGEAEDLMERAGSDMFDADRSDGSDYSNCYIRAWHSQQAAEKAIKAVLA